MRADPCWNPQNAHVTGLGYAEYNESYQCNRTRYGLVVSLLDRRNLLLGGVSLLVTGAACMRVRAESAVSLDQFLGISNRLLGIEDLERNTGEKFLEGLLASGREAVLSRFVNGADTSSEAARNLANDIVASWYSGLYETGHGTAVATYNEAMIWRALSFTKPLGNCGGATGYWNSPPDN
jgi:hypothetical protein